MKKLLIYLKDYKKETILGPLFKLLEASFELFVPLVMAAIIDKGIGTGNIPYILKLGILLIALGVIGLICSITAQYYAAKAAVGFSAKLKRALFSHIQNLSFAEIDTLGTSTMITRMTSDINQMQAGVNLVLRLFLRSPFVVIGAMVMALTIDVKAAFVFVVAIPLLSIVVFGIMLISIPLFKKVQIQLEQVLRVTRENLTGARVIRAFAKEEEEIQKFKEYNDKLTKLQVLAGWISSAMNPVTFIIVNGALIFLVWTGAWQVEGGYITQGAVVALVNYMSQILVELVKLSNLIITVTKAIACGNRIQSVFEIQSSLKEMKNEEIKTDNEHNAPVVSFLNVSFSYANASEESLTNVHFDAHAGQTIGIIGGTGSGKSTLVHLIPRFYDITKGTIKINGKNSKDYSIKELRNKIGIVPQKAVLFKGTIEDNLKWGKKDATEEEMWEALEIAQAKEFVKEKRLGLKEHIAQGGKNLSGGQRQRMTIARAVIKKPQILILDDSSSALDYTTDANLRKAIRNINPPPTVFLVSQRATSIQYADLIIVLDDGEVAGMGTHEQLLEQCLVYQEIYYSQFSRKE